MPDMKKIKAEYLNGEITLRQLAAKHGVSFSTLSKVSMKENWTDLKKQIGNKYETKLVESVAEKKAKKVDLIDTIADKMLQRIGELMEQEEITASPSNMRQLSMTLKDLREIKGVKSELDVKEQLARIEKLRKEAQGEETDKEIKVVFASDMSDYSN